MDNSNERYGNIDKILRQVYESTEPQDAWQALRERIDTALSQHGGHAHSGRLHVVFWRRAALAMAACFVAATGLLFHVVSTDRRVKPLNSAALASAPALLTQAQMEQLVRTFSQVRSLFADHQPWLMIDSAGNSQMGLTPNDEPADRKERLIIVRLMVQENGSPAGRHYTDLVAYPQQQITLTMQTTAGATIELHLVPTFRDDGQVDVDFTARGGDSHGSRITQLSEDAFTPLTQIHIGTHGFSLGATAKPVRFSERG